MRPRGARQGIRFLGPLVGLWLAACALSPGGGGHVLTKLYFGLSYVGGSVSDADFNAFLDTCIAARFPDGLTRYDTEGRWRDSAGDTVREKSVVVEIIHSGGAKEKRKLKEIIDAYKRRFSQKSVLLVEERPRVEF